MVECLALREDPEGSGGLEIAIQKDGIHTFEALILARYQMNTQVYYHRLRRIYDLYLKEYFKAKGDADFDTQDKILRHNDMTMMTEIIQDADRAGEPFQPWAERIRDRRHHRLVYESDEDAGAAQIKRLLGVFQKIKGDYPAIDFQWDLAEVSIHKLLLPDDKDATGYVQFSMIDSDGSDSLLGDAAPSFEKSPGGSKWHASSPIFAATRRCCNVRSRTSARRMRRHEEKEQWHYSLPEHSSTRFWRPRSRRRLRIRTACYLGRTAIQKILYFLQISGVPMRYRFDIYHYGPYCDRLSRDVEWLMADGVLKDASSNTRKYSNYRPDAAAEELLQIERGGDTAVHGHDQEGRANLPAAQTGTPRGAGDSRLLLPSVKGWRRLRPVEGSGDRALLAS